MTTLNIRATRLRTALSGTARPAAPPAVVLSLATLVVALVEFGAGSVGLWWVTFALGLVAGVLAGGRYLAALTIGTVLAWAVGILVESGSRTFDVAGVVSALALNARGLGWLIVVITIVYSALLVLAGCWLGAAARHLFTGYRRDDAPVAGQAELTEPSTRTEEPEHV